MFEKIVHRSCPVTLIGAGEVASGDLSAVLQQAPTLVAADGGARVALAAGHVPDAVIGDLDSLSAADRARLDPQIVHHSQDQDTTDFDKCLAMVQAPLLLAVGFLGARIDHQMAAFSSLLRFAHQPCVLIGREELVFHAPPDLSLDLPRDAVVSLFPLRPVTGRSQGLEWPIDGLRLEPGGRIGTSNRALGPIRVEMDAPGMLVVVPRGALAAVTRALGPSPDPGPDSGPSRWPALA